MGGTSEFAREGNYQYAMLVKLEGGMASAESFNFCPSVDEVVAELNSKRYTQEELQAVFRRTLV